jgi:hypothetical protein
MSEPAALARAQSLIWHAKYCAAPLHQFAVTITKEEGFELCDWYVTQADPAFIDVRELRAAVAEARRKDDPWIVLVHFRLMGLEIISQLQVN